MRLDVGRVKGGQETLCGQEEHDILELHEREVEPVSRVRYDLTARRIGNELVVAGSLGVRVRFVCGRCGDAFEEEVVEPEFTFYGEIESGVEFVDLTPDMRETILLALPAHPVCRAECRGLCPQCGVNRNRESCRCKPPLDNPWGALDRLSLR
jgi:uncharacterized protein